MALVEARIDPTVVFDNFVVGKGKGLNILLSIALYRSFSHNTLTCKSGPPGVGKTFTAEAVSEHLKRLLYSVSIPVLYPVKPSLIDLICWELLLDVAQVEDRLSRIFQTASHWNAILLLDEADVFLERRSPDNLTRNGLVSCVPPQTGILRGNPGFDDNRVTQFDKAILSRIHLLLRYNDLTRAARRQVWRNFLSRATTSSGDADVTDKELEELAIYKLNGRQVSYLTESLAFVSLISFSDKEYHVRGSGFRDQGEEQDRISTRKEGCGSE
jgi:hypothetical protein